MKILAIRGKNLASLTGEFEIDLTADPLASAGLFAITGRTGAGKSTILDALCLALFDKIPRLTNASTDNFGGATDTSEKLSGNDARAILRRGTGEGYAAVKFQGMDGKAYEAKWSIRRARQKPDGRLQSQDMTLIDLVTTQFIGRTKTEVLEEIQNRLGLTFEQFKRSVLLAQGDFAAFLKAKVDERASLLERMTGTGLYSALSTAAHQRERDERQKLDELNARLGDTAPLDPAQRAELDTQHETFTSQLKAAEIAQKSAQHAVVWHEKLDVLQHDATNAATALAQATQTWQEAAPRQEQLRAIEQAQPLRELLNNLEKSIAANVDADQHITQTDNALKVCEQKVAKAEKILEADENAYKTAESQRNSAMPELRKARALDIQLQDRQKQLKLVQKKHDDAVHDASATDQHLQSLQQQQRELQTQQTHLIDWFTTHKALQPLAAQWPRWAQALAASAEQYKKRQIISVELHAHTQQREEQSTLLQASENAWQANQSKLDEQKKLLQLREQAWRDFDADVLMSERQGLEKTRNHLETLSALKSAADQQQQALESAQQACTKRQTEIVHLDGELQTTGNLLNIEQAKLEEAERAERRLRDAAQKSASALRELLRTDEPCPVCGATDHPWASDSGALAVEYHDQAARVKALRGQTGKLTKQHSRLDGKLAEMRTQLTLDQKQFTAVQTERDACIRDWQAAVSDSGLDADVFAKGIAEQLMLKLRTVTQQLESLATREKALNDARKQVETTRQQLETTRQQQETIAQQREQVRETLASLDKQHNTGQHKLQQIIERLSALHDELADPLADLENAQQLHDDPAGFQQWCTEQVTTWQTHEAEQITLQEKLQALTGELATVGANAESLQKQVADAAQSVSEALQAAQALRAERQTYFEGQAADSIEQTLIQALEKAVADRDAARKSREQTREQHTEVKASLAHWQLQKTTRQRAQTAAETTLQQALATHSLTLETLREKLAHTAEWRLAEANALKQLEQAWEKAKVLHQEKQKAVAAHKISDMPSLATLEQAQATLIERETALKSVQEALQEIVIKLREDDKKRQNTTALQTQLTSQRERWELWAKLDEIIGSKDGQKFCKFAQSLTLEAVLGYANKHLQDLAKRYSLQRTPGSDLALQIIDHEMGDEIRGVHSLSGGESFLVSLALALGLASLSSEQIRVDSLFIDEGFGTLDADTLDVAVACLDNLQATGRTIGVISHVPALVERIGTGVHVEALGGGRSVVRIR